MLHLLQEESILEVRFRPVCLSWQPVRHAIAVFFVLQFHSIHDAIVSSDTFEQEHHISRPQTLMTLQRLIHV